jgi:hypothetical protein
MGQNPGEVGLHKEMNDFEKKLGNGFAFINILKNVFPDKGTRDALVDFVVKLNKFLIELK